MRVGLVFIFSLGTGCAAGECGNNHAPNEVVQVERLSVSSAQFVRFESIGQLFDNGNGSLATARLWRIRDAVPDGPLDAQFVLCKVCPTQTANLSLAQAGQSSGVYNGTGWLRQNGQHGFYFREVVGIGIFRLWSAGMLTSCIGLMPSRMPLGVSPV